MTRRIRVAQVVTRFIAGAGIVALRGARELDPERYDVTVLSGLGGRLVDQAAAAGIRYIPLKSMNPELSPRSDMRGVKELSELLRDGGYDVVHTHSAKAGALGRIAAHRLGTSAIVHTFHGFPFHQYQSPMRRQAYISMERRLGLMTHRFMAVGTTTAADAVRLGIAPAEHITAIAGSIDGELTPTSRGDRRTARATLSIQPGMRVVGTVGRIDYQKAPELFIRAIHATGRDDVMGVWVGDGPLRTTAELLVDRLGMRDRFLFLGDRSDVGALLPAFDVFAMSSRYEGLPCAIVEAMAAEVPVVATAVNSVPDVVIPGRTGLLAPPCDAAGLSRAIVYLLDHPEVGRRLATHARKQIGEMFAPERLGRDLDAIYRDALGSIVCSPLIGAMR